MATATDFPYEVPCRDVNACFTECPIKLTCKLIPHSVYTQDVPASQMYTRDPRPPIPPHVMASPAMGAQFGGLRVFSYRTRKNKFKANAFMIFHAGYCGIVIMLRPQYM